MAQIKWITPEGSLGTFAENTEVRILLDVENPTTPAASAGFDPRTSITGNGRVDEVAVDILPTKTAWRLTSLNLPGFAQAGAFPNDQNPNAITATPIDVIYPYRGGLDRAGQISTPTPLGPIGISAIGIVFYGPAADIRVPGMGGSVWMVNANTAEVFGEDIYGAHPQQNGQYHYHDTMFINRNAWGDVPAWKNGYRHDNGHSKIIGWAADGYPIYGPYGYDKPLRPGPIARMRSGYTAVEKPNRPRPMPLRIKPGRYEQTYIQVEDARGLFPGQRIQGPWPANDIRIINILPDNKVQINKILPIEVKPGQSFQVYWPLGLFVEDFEYTAPAGTTLDAHNGRFCITPEFPQGTYAYFSTEDQDSNPVFPYIVGPSYYGSITPDDVAGIANIEPVPSNVRFSLLSGKLPLGLQLIPTGELYGFPQVTTAGSSVSREFRFTVRVTNTAGQIADRTFSLFVNNIAPPSIIETGVRGESINSTFGNINLSFEDIGLGYYAANVQASIGAPNRSDGEPSVAGRVYLYANGAVKSVGLTRDGSGYTSLPQVTFTGSNTKTALATVSSLTKNGIEDLGYYFDGDFVKIKINALEISPTGKLLWTVSNGRLPPGLALSQTGLISGFALAPPTAGEAGTAAYDVGKYDEYVWDFEGASDSRVYQFTLRIFDGISYSYQRYKVGIYSKSYFLIDNILISADTTLYTADRDGYQYPSILTPAGDLPPVRQLQSYAFQFKSYIANPNLQVKWSVNASGPARFDQGADPRPDGNGNIYTLVPYDNKSFDQSDLSLPSGIFIDLSTGWLLGTLGTTTVYENTYEFTVTAYVEVPISNTAVSVRASQPVTYRLKVLSDIEDIVTWSTPADLGSIDNGQVSTLQISATSRSGAALTYRVKSGQYLRIPQGLAVLGNGLISGRTSFDFYSLDRRNSEITFDTTLNTYDSKYRFTIVAQDATGNIYDEKEFTLTVKNINKKPYENLYLKALLPAGLRQVFRSIVTDPNLSAEELIYRSNDPYFGVHLDLTMLVQAGVRAETASAFIDAMSNHHYDKKINFGTIKKAIARNEDGSTKYEVLYVNVLDYNTSNTPGTPIQTKLDQTPIVYGSVLDPTLTSDDFRSIIDNITRRDNFGFVVNDDIVNDPDIFANSFANMAFDVEQGIGYEFKGALPDWMLSVQPDTGQPLGLTRGLVLAYANPGLGDKLLYRYQSALEQSGYSVGDIMNTFKFTADRYQWDRTLSENYNPLTQSFDVSSTTTFDRIPSSGTVDVGAWIPQTSGSLNELYSVAYKPGYGYIAVGAGSSILSSISGQRWVNEGQSIDFSYNYAILSDLASGNTILQFPYNKRISVGDEVEPSSEFTVSSRSYITQIDYSIRLSSPLANALSIGTSLEFVSYYDGTRQTATVTQVANAGNTEVYLDSMTNVDVGYGVYVKGIDIANAAVVTTAIGTSVTLDIPTTASIPLGTQITFDDLRGNVEILTTSSLTALASSTISFATLGNVTQGYYPRITAIDSATSVRSRFLYATVSQAPTVAVAAGTELSLTHRITANATAGDTTISVSNTELLTVGTQVYNVVGEANTNESVSYATVTGTKIFINVLTDNINGQIYRGMQVIGPGLPTSARLFDITANATYSNLTVTLGSSITVPAQSNIALAFSTPTSIVDGTTIIGKNSTTITLSSPLLSNIAVGADQTIRFALTGVNLNSIISVNDRWIAVGDRGLVVDKQIGSRTWTQRFGLLYGDLKAIGYRSYISGTSTAYTFIAVGNEGTVIRSTDANSWSLPIFTSANRTLRGVDHYESTWIAVGDNGQIITSTNDGLAWTLDNTTTTLNINDIIYANQWVAVGDKGSVWIKSANGTTWQRYNTGITDSLRSIAYSNNQYVVVGSRGSILTSLDGTKWQQADRTFLSRFNGVSRNSPVPVVVGQSGVILAESPGFTVDYALRGVSFDQINFVTRTKMEQTGYRLRDGETLIFAQQEAFGRLNDGWNQFGETFGDEPESGLGFDTASYDNLTVVPGYLESLNQPEISNQRAGIWRVSISADDIVTLDFVRQILINQVVTVKTETSKLFYDPQIKPGKTVPEYSLLSTQLKDSTENTSFDGEGTRFANNRDNYNEPGTLDKYLKFPKTGVFR